RSLRSPLFPYTTLFRSLFPSLLEAAVVFKPETLVRWHRSGFRLYWRCKSRRRVGRPAVPADIRDLIRTISHDNPLWGAPRIHGRSEEHTSELQSLRHLV